MLVCSAAVPIFALKSPGTKRLSLQLVSLHFETFNVLQIVLSPQVKRWVIITYRHGISELPHELPSE